jgi:hypothetical protein
MAKKDSVKIKKKSTLKRTNRHMFMLNDLEQNALNRYLKKYKIQNKSKFIRETIMKQVIVQLEKDSPTLFDQVENSF